MKKEMIHNIIYVILGIIIGVLIMLAVWPKRIAQLSDGSEAVVTVGDKSFSANEYYEMLKGKDKLTTILREIDLYLTKQKYPNRETESTNYANERYDMLHLNMFIEYPGVIKLYIDKENKLRIRTTWKNFPDHTQDIYDQELYDLCKTKDMEKIKKYITDNK